MIWMSNPGRLVFFKLSTLKDTQSVSLSCSHENWQKQLGIKLKKKKKEKKTARERHFSSEWSGCFPTSVRCQGSKFLKLFQPFKKHLWSSTLALCEELLACGLNSEQPVSLLCFGSLHEFVALTEYAQSFVIWKVRPTEKKSTGFKDVSDYM